MGPTRWARHSKTRLYGILRAALCASVLGAGIWIGSATVASPPAGAALSCLETSVDVKAQNKTSVPLDLNRAVIGTSNKWCTLPANPIGSHKVARFEAGDDVFATEVSVSYEAPNHDLISLIAKTGNFVERGARCLVVPNGKLPSPYRCTASSREVDEHRGRAFGIRTHVLLVDWVIEGP
jgi:hypothetical protein